MNVLRRISAGEICAFCCLIELAISSVNDTRSRIIATVRIELYSWRIR